MTTDEMGSRYYGVPEPHERERIPDYMAALDEEDDDAWQPHRTRPENGGDCALWAVALVLCLGVIPVAEIEVVEGAP
jgi:hypothetical protein